VTRTRIRIRPWIVAATAMLCCGWGGNQFTPLLTLYRSRQGLSEVIVDALLAAYVLGLVPALLVGSGLSDRHGRRPLMLLALAACGAGSLLLAVDVLPTLFIGRMLSGVGIGLAMAVGTTWVVELSLASGTSAARGARRASLWLTAGLGGGAGLAGLLAQWAPLPTALPYLVQAGVTAAVGALAVATGAESLTRPAHPTMSAARRLLVPPVRHRRFRGLVLPLAPWIFGAAGIAYAIVPASVAPRLGHLALLYATALTVATLGAGVLVQPLAHRLDHPERPRSIGLAIGLVTLGAATAALTAALDLPWLGILAAVILGGGYGTALVAGLLEVGRLSDAEHLARATGIFYALAYIGFLFPMLVAIADQWAATATSLWILCGLAGACGLTIGRSALAASARRTRPAGRVQTPQPL
jgi:MFS family permease